MKSILEGLRDSDIPCARRLSVSGFFAITGRFLSAGGFILRVRRGSFCPEDPLLFNPNSETGDGQGAVYATVCTAGMYGGYVRAGYTYQCIQGGIYTRVYLPPYHGGYRASSRLPPNPVSLLGPKRGGPGITTFSQETPECQKPSKDTSLANDYWQTRRFG